MLFTALHHSREAVSLSMVVKVVALNLRFLYHNYSSQQTTTAESQETRVIKSDEHFTYVNGPSSFPSLFSPEEKPQGQMNVFDFADILFVPVVNLDGYSYISLNFGRKTWQEARSKRKNFNTNSPCE